MANSKANIYPIQLQGAELNLNKYDAEIKNYSGFNKNNAPFVGGCLSNIFTKDETIEGGNSDSVYISEKGDIYTLRDNELFCNDKSLIKYNDTVSFYDKRQINIDLDVVKLIDENIYVTLEPDCTFEANAYIGQYSRYKAYGFVAYWNGYRKVIADAETFRKSFIEINTYNDEIVFSIKTNKRFTTSDAFTTYGYVLYVPNKNEETSYNFDIYNGGSIFKTPNCSSQEIYSHGLYINDDYIVYAGNDTNTSSIVVINKSDRTYFSKTSFIDETTGSKKILSTYFSSWHMTDDGCFNFVRSGYNNNSRITVQPPLNDGGGGAGIIIRFKLKINNNSTVSAVNESISYRLVNQETQDNYRSVKNHTGDITGVLKNYGAAYLTVFNKTDDTTKIFNVLSSNGIADYGLSIENGKLTTHTGKIIPHGNFKILINENIVSNISIYNKNIGSSSPYDYQGNLIEDWNIIDEDSISFDGGSVVYKTTSGKWYKVYPSTAKLSLKYNQLVINCNVSLNAVAIQTNKILHFASDWNSSYLSYKDNSDIFNLGTIPSGNNRLLASAVNEYKQENNSSIILNMMGVYNYMVVGEANRYDFYTDFIKNNYYVLSKVKTSPINFYVSAISDNKAEYMASGYFFDYFNDELIGLPFPNDSNGNVQYNPCIFSDFVSSFGMDVFIKINNSAYQLSSINNNIIMSFYLGTLVEGLDIVFILQGQYYGIINNQIFALQFYQGVIASSQSVVSVQGLQFCGNNPYEALFYSKTNRCLYSFTGANILQQKQLVDKISRVKSYKYNPATQSIFLLTDIGVIVSSLFGTYQIDMSEAENMFLLDNGVVLCDNEGHYRYIRYYKEDTDSDYVKQNIHLETCYYGMNNQTVTINDTLYMRLFSEEHEEGDLEISATTLSLEGRMTEKTTFKIKANDWDKMTHTIYLRYQPKEQRGLGISFKIISPFKIASMSVGSQADAILVDKVSKGAITAPQVTSSNIKW